MAKDDAAVEHPVWVTVRVHKLDYLSYSASAVMQTRWLHRRMEHEWEQTAAAEGPSDDAGRRLETANRLLAVMFGTEYTLSCMTSAILDDLDGALHPRRRPCPRSAVWWRSYYGGNGGERRSRFVHVSRDQAARARGLVAGALALALRLGPLVDDLRQICWGAPAAAADAAGLHATPRLLERLRRAQRLADAVLAPLHEVRRLADGIIAGTGAGGCEPRRRGGRRARSAPPPSHRRPADPGPPQPVLRRTASV